MWQQGVGRAVLTGRPEDNMKPAVKKPTPKHFPSRKSEFLLELKGIVKSFPGVLANDNIDFELMQGEIHALLGENGTGKSTLMKIAYGIYRPDSGVVRIRGETISVTDPRIAVAHGIGMVHQHFMLVPSLTVLENIMLGFEPRNGPFLDRVSMERDVFKLFERVKLPQVPLHVPVATLSVGEQQRVEIIKALMRGAEILIFDEPTAVLTPQEVEGLGQVLLQLKENGFGIVLITHKLDEVMKYSDRVTVLRNGRWIRTAKTSTMNKLKLAKLMVGREVKALGKSARRSPARKSSNILELRDVSVTSPDSRRLLHDLSLTVREGEILGVAGVAGNGQEILAETIVGLREINSGTIWVRGQEVANWTVRDSIAHGIAYIPEDRQRVGLVLDLSIAENLILKKVQDPPFSSHGRLNWQKIRKHAEDRIATFDVRPPLAHRATRALSGGNQQKVILAREIGEDNKIIVAAEPTRGLDIGSVDYIHRTLLKQRDNGKGVLLISTDLDEILNLSNRIAVLHRGEIPAVIERSKATREQIGLLMAGAKGEK